MRRLFGGYPPRYGELLRLTLFAALIRLVPLVPFVLAYLFLPPGSWFRLLLLLCPALWVYLVWPARVRYGEIVAAFAADPAAPLRARDLLVRDPAWADVCRGRAKLMRRQALPLCVQLLFLLLLFILANPFTAVKVLLDIFGGIATVLGAMAAFLPRLMMGEPMAAEAGLLGGMVVLAAVLALCLFQFGRGAFRSSACRFGYTAGMPEKGALEPLFKRNLRLWLPTLTLLLALCILYGQELGLMLANALGAAPLFAVKWQIPELILALLAAVSYLLALPVRKLNTAMWAREYEEIRNEE